MNDLRLALRLLFKNPGFTFIAIVTLGLGIGVNTAMFSLLNAILFRDLPYPEADRVVRIFRTSPHSKVWPHSVPNFLDYQAQSKQFEKMAAFFWDDFNISEPGELPERVDGMLVTTDFFSILGLQPTMGRAFRPEEDRPGQNNVVIISHDFWQNRFGGESNIVGRTLRLNGEAVTIVGVMPAAMDYPLLWGFLSVWRPMGFSDEVRQEARRNSHWIQVLGKLKTGISRDQAQSELNFMADRLAREHPFMVQNGLRLVSLPQTIGDDTYRGFAALTMGLAGFVLLIACANLANLQFARTVGRSRELAIRTALGATRHRLVRQWLSESLLLALLGGGLGLLLASWTGDFLGSRLLVGDRAGVPVPLDWTVLSFALLVSVATGMLFGIWPAVAASRISVNEALKQSGRGSTFNRSQHRMRHGLIVAEVALSLLLLTGAGSFLRGLQQFIQRDPGWRVDGLLTAQLNLPSKKYSDEQKRLAFFDQLESRLKELPGVEQAALSWSLPIWAFSTTDSFVIDGREIQWQGQDPLRYYEAVSSDYFETFGITLREGRFFTPKDNRDSPRVVIINESMARRFWPNESAIGKRVSNSMDPNREWQEVVGVVSDVRFAGNLAQPETRWQAFGPLAQSPRGHAVISLRTKGAPEKMSGALRQLVAELDPDLPVYHLGSARQSVDHLLKNFALIGTVLACFALLGLMLAAIGIYGVIAGYVAQRSNEIGVRMALGAQSRDVLWLVIRKGVQLALIGSLFGFAGSFFVARVLRAAAPELPSADPLMLLLVSLFLLGVALLACWLPARRAARIDPMKALRCE